MGYSEYPLSNFPTSQDSFLKMRNLLSSELSLINQYQAYMRNNQFTEAQAILTTNPSLLEVILDCDKINKLTDAVQAIEKFYLENIQDSLDAILVQSETDLDAQLTTNQTTFNNWYETIQATLDENTAGNLQNQINTANTNITTLQNANVPTGGIIMYSGLESNIPTEFWAICNGQNGTPDLRDRFIVGSGGTYAIGDTGGSDTVSLTESNLPQHKHEVSILSTSNGAVTPTATVSTTGSHSHTKGTLVIGGGSHTHTGDIGTATLDDIIELSGYSQFIVQSGTGAQVANLISTHTQNDSHSHTLTINSATHTHTLTGSTSDTGDHSHTVTISAIPNHTHNVAGDTDYTGGDIGHENRPPYFALAFIMKL